MKSKKNSSDPSASNTPSSEAYGELYRRMFSEPGYILRRLHQISVSFFLEGSKDYQITQVQFATLIAIGAYPGIDQTSLGKSVVLDRTTVSNVVNRLLRKGFLKREKRDQRTNALFLTNAGHAVIQAVEPRIRTVGSTLLKPLTRDEREVFVRLLNKLVDQNNQFSRVPYTEVGASESKVAETAIAEGIQTRRKKTKKVASSVSR